LEWFRLKYIHFPAIVAIIIAAAAFAIVYRLKLTNETTVAITAFYATLVFFQLQEMKQQREDLQNAARRQIDEEHRRRPILEIASTVRTSPEYINNTPRALGCYITLTLTNVGLRAALRCQPVLTMLYERGHFEGGRLGWSKWERWIPVPLLWSLDESNVTSGRPTAERDLVPRRPYMFDLGGCSTLAPDDFNIRSTAYPFAQPMTFRASEHCFEITVFSENAEPVVKFVRVNWHGEFSLPVDFPLEAERLRKPPPEIMQRIEVEELSRDRVLGFRDI
jgi:hypothetical protein